jgi:hypothetical protein
MNTKLLNLIYHSHIPFTAVDPRNQVTCKTIIFDERKFAELIFIDIIENLSFHGHTDAISQVQWHAANKYGIKL